MPPGCCGRPDDVPTASPPLRCLRAIAMLIQLGVVWLGAVVVAPRLGVSRRNALVARFAAGTLAILGVRVRAVGAQPLRTGPVLVVANHVSWLDVYLLNAVLGGTRHVAKSEVAGWPV